MYCINKRRLCTVSLLRLVKYLTVCFILYSNSNIYYSIAWLNLIITRGCKVAQLPGSTVNMLKMLHPTLYCTYAVRSLYMIMMHPWDYIKRLGSWVVWTIALYAWGIRFKNLIDALYIISYTNQAKCWYEMVLKRRSYLHVFCVNKLSTLRVLSP